MTETSTHPPSPGSRWIAILRSRWALVGLLYAVAVLSLGRTRGEVVGANDASRYATMIALVEQGTFAIDRVPLAQRTMDKVKLEGRTLSSKPPVLSVIGAGVYAALYHGLGIRFDRHEGLVVRVIVLLFGTVPLLLLLWAFHGLLVREDRDPAGALGATALLGLGTLCFPFSTILVNHLPSTAAIFLTFVAAHRVARGAARPERLAFLGGLSAGLAVVFELAAIFPALAFLGYLLWASPAARRGRVLAALVLGGLGPAAAQVGLGMAVTGSLLPVQLRGALWQFEGSYWNAPRSWDALGYSKPVYGLLCFLGGRGWFTLTPVLLLGLVAGARAIRRPETLAVLAGFVGLAAFIILRTNNFGGGHYGMRWFLMLVPPWLFLTYPVLAAARRPWQRIGLAALILPGVYTAQIYWFGKPTVYELLLMRWGILVLPP
jgi:hypothetical protein